MKFQPGISGNPSGRPRGIKDRRTTYTETIESMVPSLLEVLQSKALAGDLTAIKMLLDRVLPNRKAESNPVIVDSNDGLSNQAQTVLAQILTGAVSPEAGASAITAIQGVAKIIEVDELIKRVEALESAQRA